MVRRSRKPNGSDGLILRKAHHIKPNDSTQFKRRENIFLQIFELTSDGLSRTEPSCRRAHESGGKMISADHDGGAGKYSVGEG